MCLYETDYVFTTMQSDFKSWLLADSVIADVPYLSGIQMIRSTTSLSVTIVNWIYPTLQKLKYGLVRYP